MTNNKGIFMINNIVLDDFEIIERFKPKKVLVKCKICGRRQLLSSLPAFTKRNNIHGNICSKIILNEFGGKNSEEIKQFYSIWCNLRTRTTNPNYEKWDRYGGRGINSEEFKYFVDFYDKMFESYLEHVFIFGKENTTIDRINNDGNYCFDNCRWVTWNEQAKNKEYLINYHAIDPDGNEFFGINLKLFCENHNLKYENIYGGIYQGNKTWENNWFFEKV